MLERFLEGLLTSPPVKPPVTPCEMRTVAPPTKEAHMSVEQPYFCQRSWSLNWVMTLSSTWVRPYCTCMLVVGEKTCIQLTPYCCAGISVEVKSVGRVLGDSCFHSMPE